MKKDELLKSGGYSFFHRYRNEKKAAIVDALAGRVLEEFALGRSYGPSSYVMSAAGLEAHRQAKASALAELVANTTDDDIRRTPPRSPRRSRNPGPPGSAAEGCRQPADPRRVPPGSELQHGDARGVPAGGVHAPDAGTAYSLRRTGG
ncbi:hypothetical protein MNU23_31410 [Pseudomonas aeruginosa]|uniref:hypothetical protein n=1 Tax=Pseudomonas aeruginosa TaxID=287 RepID=UPI0021A5345A|nr:hypothetical protein [Pseudomonas aeruginosa]MCT2416181.1 hypothetical protein [Pseudomonas aeruginosa]